MSYALFDRSNKPLIRVKFTGEKATEENFKLYLEGLSTNYQNEDKIAIMFDASLAVFPSIKYQRKQADWLQRNEFVMQRYCLAVAYVIPNRLIREALKLIFAVQGQPAPYKIFPSIDEADVWLKAVIEDAAE